MNYKINFPIYTNILFFKYLKLIKLAKQDYWEYTTRIDSQHLIIENVLKSLLSYFA